MLNTSLFTLFLITSALTVATPGPGVLMTLTSSIRYGLRTAIYVILGTATGTVVMAAISSTGLGLLIATSPAAYEAIKGLGALYMVYLGLKLFKAKPFSFDLAAKEKPMGGYRQAKRCFVASRGDASDDQPYAHHVFRLAFPPIH